MYYPKKRRKDRRMSNKTLGNGFEAELSELLSQHGFWVHLLNANKAGQPADIVAVKNKVAHLIDAKVCSNRGFALSRVEENQELAMALWVECGNGLGWFAIKIPTGEIYMLPHVAVIGLKHSQSSLSFEEIAKLGIPLEKWVAKCK